MEQKKIGFWTVVFFVFGSCVGTGIFFKNKTILANTNSISLLLFSWILAIFAIVCLCFSLKEIVHQSKLKNESGFLGWIKTFCKTRFYKGFRNFMLYFYMPSLMFFLPYYAIQSVMDALSLFFPSEVIIPFWGMILLSLLVFFYVTIVPMFSKKAVLVQSNIFSFLKFIPLLFGIIGGIIIFATFGHGTAPNHFFEPNLPPRDEPTPFNLTNCTPFLGIIASIPAIFFSFDGFYNSSSLETKMKNPQNFSKAMILGILVVAAIYLTFSLGMALGAKDGTIIGLENAWESDAIGVKVIKFILLLLISFAVLGTANNWGLYITDSIKSSVDEKTFLFSLKTSSLNNWKKCIFIELFLFSYFIFFTLVGCFFIDDVIYDNYKYYDVTSKKIFSFIDIITNWSSLFVFIGLGITIFGFLISNKNCELKVKIFSWLGIFFIAISTLFEVSNCIISLFSSIIWQFKHSDTKITEYIIPNILKTLLLAVIVWICFFNKNKEQSKNIENINQNIQNIA